MRDTGYVPPLRSGSERMKKPRKPTVTTRQHKVHTQLGRAAVRIFAANDRMNQILIEHLDPTAWRAKPPGKASTIAIPDTNSDMDRLRM